MSQRIAKLLRTALVEDGPLADSLYEYELAEHIDEWYEGLKADRDHFVFVVTENTGHIAMAMIMADKTVLVNDAARTKLMAFWKDNYRLNMIQLIPAMVQDLVDGYVFVTGVKVVDTKKTKRIWRK